MECTVWSVKCGVSQRCAFFLPSTSTNGPSMVFFVHVDLTPCFAPQRRALFRHLSQLHPLPKVVRAWCPFYILNWTRASRHNTARLRFAFQFGGLGLEGVFARCCAYVCKSAKVGKCPREGRMAVPSGGFRRRAASFHVAGVELRDISACFFFVAVEVKYYFGSVFTIGM